jgi:hypothetical protein
VQKKRNRAKEGTDAEKRLALYSRAQEREIFARLAKDCWPTLETCGQWAAEIGLPGVRPEPGARRLPAGVAPALRLLTWIVKSRRFGSKSRAGRWLPEQQL